EGGARLHHPACGGGRRARPGRWSVLLVQAPADATVPPMLRRCPDRSRASTRVAPLLLLFTLGCDRSPQRAPAEPLSAGSDDVSGRDVSGRPGAPPAERAPQDASAAAQARDVAAPNVECPPWTELGPYLAVRFEGQARDRKSTRLNSS